ncbi:type 4 pilus major pilin [Salmonella enterica]
MQEQASVTHGGQVVPVTPYRPLRGITLGISEANFWAVLAGVVIVSVLAALAATYLHMHNNTEMETVQSVITTTQNELGTNGVYNYDGADDMTGTLAEAGGLPSNITVVGDKSSGSATLLNIWKGALTVEPVAGSDGSNTSFLVTEEEVPQDACIQLSTGISAAGLTSKVAVNGTETEGVLEKSDAASQCTEDDSGQGTNILKFTVAG